MQEVNQEAQRRFRSLAAGFACAALAACSGSDSGGSDQQYSVSGSLSGQVSSTVLNSNNTATAKFASATANNVCVSSSFEVLKVGGNGTPLATGTANADGTFSVTWDESVDAADALASEVVVRFNCNTSFGATLRCYGRPGDTGLRCDSVANAIVSSLEDALGASVETDSVYAGLSVAKIAEGIGETLRLASRLDPTNDIADRLSSASSVGEVKRLLEESSVGTLFDSLQTLAQETKATNEAGDNADTQQVLASVWTVEKVTRLLVGLGIDLEIAIDDGNDGPPTVYGELADLIDSMTQTEFMAKFAEFLSTLHTQIGDGTERSLSMLCIARDYQNWEKKPVEYPPDVAETLTGGIKRLTCLGQSAQDLKVVNDQSQVSPNVRVHLSIRAAKREANRNDRDGRYERQGSIRTEIGLVDVFDEFEQGFEQGPCAQYVDNTPQGPGPNTDWASFGTCARENGLDKYFSGVIGVYRFLIDTSLRNVRASLADIHDALVTNMNIRLGGRAPFTRDGVGVMVSDAPNDNYSWIPLTLQDTGTLENGRRVYNYVCPDLICQNGMPWDNVTLTSAQVAELAAANKPNFDSLMGMFTELPQFDEIRQWTFESAHHEPYNIAGPKFFHVAGKDLNSDWRGDAPILCAMKNGTTVVREFTPGTTQVMCEVAQGTWTDGRVQAGGPDYSKHFGLQERGDFAGDRYYALINLFTGYEYHLDGRQFRIRDISRLNSPNETPDGSTLRETDRQFCNTFDGPNGNLQTDCWYERFRYVTLQFPNDFFPPSNYFPFVWNIQIAYADPTGQKFENNLGVAVAQTNPGTPQYNPSQDFAVCVKSQGVVVGQNRPDLVQQLGLAGNIADCFTLEGETFYYLAHYWGTAADRGAYQYQLVRNDGLWMRQINLSEQEVDALVSLTDVEAQLQAGQVLGPQAADVWMGHYEVANLGHDPKFDPYCLDEDGDAACDCYRDTTGDGTFDTHLNATSTPSAQSCTLADKGGDEPTLSEPPVWPGDPTAAAFWKLVEACGGQSGATLGTCFANNGGNNVWVDWTRLMECENTAARLQWVDMGQISSTPSQAGGGCGLEGQNGPVRLLRPVQRKNAFDVARPETLVKLVSAATASVGTGVTLDPNTESFTFSEALAFAFVRLSIPLQDILVKGPDIAGNNAANFVEYPGFTMHFEQVEVPNSHREDAVGAVLRKFLTKGGFL